MLTKAKKIEVSTPRRALFVREYVKDFDATKAAIRAGYAKGSAHVAGSRLIRDDKIKSEIARITAKANEKLEITPERVLAELARLAYCDPRKFLNKDGTAKNPHELDDDTAMSLAGFEVTELFEGSGEDKHIFGHLKKFKIADKGVNLERLGRYLKLFTDKQELSGPGGQPIQLVHSVPRPEFEQPEPKALPE